MQKSDSKYIRFGKHNGKTYGQVRTQDKSYCDWVLKQKDVKGGMLYFQNYLKDAPESDSEKPTKLTYKHKSTNMEGYFYTEFTCGEDSSKFSYHDCKICGTFEKSKPEYISREGDIISICRACERIALQKQLPVNDRPLIEIIDPYNYTDVKYRRCFSFGTN